MCRGLQNPPGMPTSLLLAIAVAAGVAAGVFLDPTLFRGARWCVAVFAASWFVAAARGRLVIARWCFAIALAASCVLIAADAHHKALHSPLRDYLDERFGGYAIGSASATRADELIQIEGVLLSDASLTDIGATMLVRVERVAFDGWPDPVEGGVSLGVVGALAAESIREWRAGRTIRAPVALRRPARYLNSGVPDGERALARRGISLVGTVKSAALVQVVRRGSALDEAAAAVRDVVRRALTRHVAPHARQSAAIAIAILIGDRSSLDPVVEQRLQEAGTYHVIAISGGNIAILAGVVLVLLWLARIREGWAAGGAIAVLVAYAFVAGGGASVMRATIMAALYLALRTIDQRTAPLHAISVTLAAVLLATPLAVADVGLWLTFGATAAIIVGARVLPLPRHRWLRAPAALLLASLSAEVVLLPIVAFVFQRVTIAGLTANLAAIPAMAIAQVSAIVTAMADAAGIDAVAATAGWITHLSVRALLDSSAIVDAAPWLTWRVPSPAMPVLVAYYGALVAALLIAKWRRPAAVAALLLFWIAAAPHTWARTFGDGKLHVTMMDVGQGDAVLVTFPNGRTLMVDTGGVAQRGDFDIGDRVLGPALRHRGVRRLDYLAVTHGDHDHIGGALSLVRDFRPLELWYGTYVNHHLPSMQLQSMAHYQRSGWRWLLAADRMQIGGVEVRVHHPPSEDWQRQKVRNDDSLVVELRYGRVSVLLTGDIGKEVEEALLPTLDLLPIVVLKSPHHGSATSSSEGFVRALDPRIVLISCGRGNPFGHPVPRVLARYRAAQSEVFRTDLDGQIDLITDGETLSTVTFTGRTHRLPSHEESRNSLTNSTK